MPFPQLYAWIKAVPDAPKMIAEGIKLVGIREYPGHAANNPIIMNMADDLAIPRDIYPDDETAWCGLAQNWLCLKCDKPLSYVSGKKIKYDLVRAKNFQYWGSPSALAMFGDVLVFDRPGGFHVGMYVGEDETHYHVMGGNQGNAYGFVRMERRRLIASRRFYATAAPASVKQIILAPNGIISTNES